MAPSAERLTYAIEMDVKDREEAAVVSEAVFEVLELVLRSAVVDAYSDYRDQLPREVEEAEAVLRALGARQHGRDTGMAVTVERGSPEWDQAVLYAPWSIHVELNGQDGRELATLHDCCRSVTVDVTSEEAAVLRRRVAVVSRLVPLAEFQMQRREERTAARWRHIRAVAERLRRSWLRLWR